MRPINKYWQKISLAGVNENMAFYGVQKRKVFNKINTSVMALALVWLGYRLTAGNATNTMFYISLVPLACTIVCMMLMFRNRFSDAITLSFVLYPPVVMLYATLSGQVIFLFYHFLLCSLVFFFVRKTPAIVFFNVYILGCFVAGNLMFQPLNGKTEISTLFVVVTVFSIVYITFHSIKEGVLRYELGIRRINSKLEEAKKEIEVQNQKVESYSLELEEKAKSLTELNEIKTRLFSILSHDLKGHLHGFHKVFSVASEPGMDGRFLAQMLPSLKKDAEDAIALIEGILIWSKTLLHSAEPDKQVVDVGHLVTGVTNFFASAAGKKELTFKTAIAKNLVSFADRNMLETVFRNIISNAVKFSTPGLPITIEGMSNRSTLTVTVTDYGVGMQQQELNTLLTKEAVSVRGTFNEAGSGIGLLLTKELLEKNNGSLKISSSKGMGTKVQIKLPVYDDIAV